MLKKSKNIIEKARNLISPEKIEIRADDAQAARDYIAAYWHRLERYHPKDDETLVGLPKPYLVPAYEEGHEHDFNELYYWDSYFMVQGMLDGQHKELVMGVLEDLLFLQKRYRVIPNASRSYLTGRSQPPFLTTFIFDVYDTYDPGKKWLAKAIDRAKDEYNHAWMGTNKPNWRQVHRGLSRYYDINYLNDLAEAESGWDLTPRFNHRALDYLPVDLNSLLYKYEMDFARAAEIFGNNQEAEEWKDAANRRRRTMNELMWNQARGFYYDYNYIKQKRGSVNSLAGYFPLWAGMVDETRAQKLIKNLKKFEQKGGLSTTDAQQFSQLVSGGIPTQWAYPNGWAPLHLLVVRGLEKYGYHQEARRIALKWLKTNLDWYNKDKVFLEKYNVAQPDKPPIKGLYPSQIGFGWTNAVFERFCRDYLDSK
jgi:alpha,alpha-trehalase